MTFEEYLREAASVGQIDFSLRATPEGPAVRFYIHPTGKNGRTVDYHVLDNELVAATRETSLAQAFDANGPQS